MKRPVSTGTWPGGDGWLRRLAPAALVLYAGFRLARFLADGLPFFFDGHSHVSRVAMAAQALAAGQVPAWSYEWYLGFRPFGLFSPLHAVLTACVALGTGDPVAATKLVLWAGQLVSALGLYAFCRALGAEPVAAAAAGVLLVDSPGVGWVLGVVGAHPNVWIFAALPWLLWACAPQVRRRSSNAFAFAACSLGLGVVVLAHPLNALVILPGFLAFEATRLWQLRSDRGPWRRDLAISAASLCAAGVLAACVVLPGLAELERVGLSLERSSPTLRAPSLRSLGVLLGLLPFSLDHVYLRGHGLVWTALGLAGAALSLAAGGRCWRPLAAGLAANLGAALLLGERAAIGLAFFLLPSCAAAAAIAGERVGSLGGAAAARGVALALLAAALVAPHVGPRDESPRYLEQSALDVYARLPETRTRSRTFDVTPSGISFDGFYGASSFSPWRSGRAVPFGAYPQGAPLASYVTLALFGKLSDDLRGPDPLLSQDALDALYLAHVQLLVERGDEPLLGRVRLEPGAVASRAGGVLALRHGSPAIFAPRLERLPPAYRRDAGDAPSLVAFLVEEWRRRPLDRPTEPSIAPLFRTSRRRDWQELLPLLRAMGIDRPASRADRIFVESLLSAAEPEPPPAASPRFAVLRHSEAPGRVEIEARASAPGFARLSYAFDPALSVRLDGQPTAFVPDALGGALVLGFPEGRHTITLRPPGAALRGLLLLACAALAAALAGVLLVELARSRRRRPVDAA